MIYYIRTSLKDIPQICFIRPPSESIRFGIWPKNAALCVIFTILVSFSWDNELFASKAKINVVWNFLEWSGPEVARGVRKKFQTTLILVFEVIMQPPKTHYLTFSSETKIIKITHSSRFSTKQCHDWISGVIIWILSRILVLIYLNF